MKPYAVFLAVLVLVLASLACEIPGMGSETVPPTALPAEVALPTAVEEKPTKAADPTLDIGSTMTGKDGAILVYVPAGKFTMGGHTEDAVAECKKLGNTVCKKEWFTNQEPPRTMTLDAFWIDQFEITNGKYAKCLKAEVCKEPLKKKSYTHSSYFDNPKYIEYPVIFVNWNMAKTYCEWVGRRLPTEAEWEKAARGPSGNKYPWGNAFDGRKVNSCDENCPIEAVKNFFDDGYAELSPVGHYLEGKSVYGAFDMSGNVEEWTSDWFSATYYQTSPTSNPTGPATGNQKSVRGNSWQGDDYNVQVSNRYSLLPDSINSNLGFRCAATP